MSKKLLSVILALALALSCFAVSAFALGDIGYEGDEDAAYYTQAWALGEPEVDGDGNYVVDVTLDANYYVGPIQFKVKKTVSDGSLTLVDAYAEDTDIPDDWNADVSFDDSTGEVAVIPNPTKDADALNCDGGKVIATLVYEASADVAATLVIDIADAKNASNPDGTLIAARMSDGNVVRGAALTGQTVSDKTNTVSIGAAVSNPPKLVVVDGTIGVIDTSRTDLTLDGETVDGYLLGFDIYANGEVSEVFEVVGDGTMEIIPNAEGLENTTGAVVQVVDLDGNVVARYVLIVFGDVNGDFSVDPTDANIIELYDGFEVDLDPYQVFAGDVNVDYGTDPTDANIIELFDGFEEDIVVADIIAALGL